MSGAGWRVAVVGATGALGSEVLSVLEERRFPVRELVLVAGPRSAGDAIDFRGEPYPVAGELPDPDRLDWIFLCAPPAVCLDLAPAALRGAGATVDLSGGLAGQAGVPLLVAGAHAPREALAQPLVSTPAGPALAWILALAPLQREFGLRRVVGTALEAASGSGRRGIEALSSESIALFNQQDPPAPQVFGHPVAFDCMSGLGEPEPDGATRAEAALAAAVRRVLGGKVAVAATAVQVPTFCGDGGSLALEIERPAAVEAARAVLRDAEGVRLWEEGSGPTTRGTTGRDVVQVGRVRRDPSCAGGILLWLAADTLRLAAANAVRLAEARLRAG